MRVRRECRTLSRSVWTCTSENPYCPRNVSPKRSVACFRVQGLGGRLSTVCLVTGWVDRVLEELELRLDHLVESLGFRVQGSGLMVYGLGFMTTTVMPSFWRSCVYAPRRYTSNLDPNTDFPDPVGGFGFMVWCSGFGVWGRRVNLRGHGPTRPASLDRLPAPETPSSPRA